MPKETCSGCGRSFKTYHLRDGKCRICLRTNDNAYDLDMLTEDEKEAFFGIVEDGEIPENVKDRMKYAKKKQLSDEEKVIRMFQTLSDDEREQILKDLQDDN